MGAHGHRRLGRAGRDVSETFRGAGADAPLDDLVARLERGEFNLVAVGRSTIENREGVAKVHEGRAIGGLAPVAFDTRCEIGSRREVGEPTVDCRRVASHRPPPAPLRRTPRAPPRRVHYVTAWVDHAIWWQVYPLGFVGAYPADPAPTTDEHRLRRITAWLDHALELGASGVALGPIFASRTHGYDTTDHYRIDPRLGDDDDFDRLVAEAKSRGLRLLLDGVFNHVGADFARYREALDGGGTSWFRKRDNHFDTFEGHDGLIALNHDEPDVAEYVADVMAHWLRRGVDGWRLDAAYAVPPRFWRRVLPRVREEFGDAWFVGEVIHGDYPAIVRAASFDSVTQYELWKAIWSSLNDGNFHELDHALRRHDDFCATFVPMTFVGNHDVTRIASQVDDPRHAEHALAVLMTTAGTPSVYAGDEWAYRGVKEERAGGDDAIRPEFPPTATEFEHLGHDALRLHQHLIGLRRRNPWLHAARTTAVRLTNEQYVYRTSAGDDVLVVALNVADTELRLSLRDTGIDSGRVVAGSGLPSDEVIDHLRVEPHGWCVVAR